MESSVYGKIVSNTTYNELGKLFDLSLGNGLTTSYRYWGLDYGGNAHYGLLYSIATDSHQNLTYSDYDAVGNIKQMIDVRNSNETINFGYDHLDRLTSASSGLFSEWYSYDSIGNFQSKGGVGYAYPSPGSARPHAPTSVGGNGYSCDNNGNLIGAEGRTYEYDAQNRLSRVLESGNEIRSFVYDGDGALRIMVQSGQTIRYVMSDYRVNASTGEATVYYRFGGRAVAYRTYNPNNPSSDVLRYVLSDHLASSNAEVGQNQAELGQRRMYPYGSDRAVSGASDIADEERFTSQRRIDSGGGNVLHELYHYGARWYLPCVGIFTQPDTVVPDYRNPQALNRYCYGYNNPVKYVDPTGLAGEDLQYLVPNWFDQQWRNEFQREHGREPSTDADYVGRFVSVGIASKYSGEDIMRSVAIAIAAGTPPTGPGQWIKPVLGGKNTDLLLSMGT